MQSVNIFSVDKPEGRLDVTRMLGSTALMMFVYDLIWRVVCQGLRLERGWSGGSAEGAAGLAGARRLVRLICAGWVPQDRFSS